MYIIAENIHVVAPAVAQAIKERDAKFFQDMAVRQVDAGASAVDLNIGPQKREGEELLPWLVKTVEEVVDVPLVFDTTNLDAIRAACRVVSKAQPIINSVSAKAESLEAVPQVAAEYNTRLIGLTMESGMIPVSADERVTIAIESLIPRILEVGLPMEDFIIDPLVLTVSGCQEYCPEFPEAVRMLKFAWDPAPKTNAGVSNVSNAVPYSLRPLLNRVYQVIIMGVGIDVIIADPFDKDMMEFIRIVEERDDSTSLGRSLLKLHDRIAAMEDPQASDFDLDDPQQEAIWKTVQILQNKVIYADSFLRF